MPLTRIVLADEHRLVRQGLSALLSGEEGLEIVGETGDGNSALALIQKLEPDILVLSLNLPGPDGASVTRRARELLPRCRVLLLSAQPGGAGVAEALRAGALGCVPMTGSGAELVRALHELAAGRPYASPGPELTDREPAETEGLPSRAPADKYALLTRREREVLSLAAEGYSNIEIGLRLGVSPRTVEIHRGNMMRKLELFSQTALIRYALRRGLISLDD
jgi:DNA-binding NarL/FixJ family response regulator